MKLLNQIGVETNWGYRTFELYHGNLMKVDNETDLIVVSAFERNYPPTKGTVVRALLQEHDLSVKRLAEDPVLDYRDAFGCWLSKPVSDPPFDRILCVETPRSLASGEAAATAVENLFVMLSVMEAKGYGAETLAMPLIGAGQQRFEPQHILSTLLPASRDWLQRSRDTQSISFVELDAEKASALDATMNDVLGRIDVTLERENIIETVCSDLSAQLRRIERTLEGREATLLHELRHVLEKDEIRSFEIGILSRRMVELVLRDLAGNRTMPDVLWKQIQESADWGVAPWVRSYMHTLRYFGNEAAHEAPEQQRRPRKVDSPDLTVCLFCLQRVASFWEENRNGNWD